MNTPDDDETFEEMLDRLAREESFEEKILGGVLILCFGVFVYWLLT